MHGDGDDSTKQVEDSIILLRPLFKLDVLVPKGMSQEIEANAGGTSFKQTVDTRSVGELEQREWGSGVKECKHQVYVCMRRQMACVKWQDFGARLLTRSGCIQHAPESNGLRSDLEGKYIDLTNHTN